MSAVRCVEKENNTTEYKALEETSRIKFVKVLPEEALNFKSNGVTIQYIIYKDHVFVKGSMFTWNWDSSFNKATKALLLFLDK